MVSVNPCFNVHDAVQPGHFTEQAVQVKRWPAAGDLVKASEFLEPLNGFRVNGFVNGRRSGSGPTKPLQAIAGVDDLQRHGSVVVTFEFDIPVGVLLHVHEDEGGKFKPADNDFDSGPCVATSAPRILHVGDFACIDAKGLG